MFKRLLFAFMLLVNMNAFVSANELTGEISIEGDFFFYDPLYNNQEQHDVSFAVLPNYYHEFTGGSSITFTLFGRYDSADEERTHYDIRELNVIFLGESFELKAGISKVFWGTTEFVHLVDIINQTDGVESVDGEDKLGQPMVHLSIPSDWGTFNFFVLPYFRERTFAGEKGRLRYRLRVDSDNPRYESNLKERHIDIAVRYTTTVGNFDVGMYYFRGTGREPRLEAAMTSDNEPVLVPYYEQINQPGFDIQGVIGSWLLKGEGLYRNGQGDRDFFAVTGGVEYTFSRIFAAPSDLGIVAESAWDERQENAETPFQNDIMLGLRVAFNDQAGSEILFGTSQDLESSARTVSLEANTRFGECVKMFIELRFFMNIQESDPLYSFRDEDYIKGELVYYF